MVLELAEVAMRYALSRDRRADSRYGSDHYPLVSVIDVVRSAP